MSVQPALAFERVSFAYGHQLVVEDVSLLVQPGDFVGLIGPNGSGKSTLMRLAVGLLRPRSGRVCLFGQPLARFRDWRRLGYVPQVSAARADFPATVAEVVATGRVGRRGPFRWLRGYDHTVVERAIERVGMVAFRDRLIGQLSGGQRQRVMLARALAGEPDLLLLDEPTAGVDAAAQAELLQLLKALCRDTNLAVLYVAHNVEVLRPYLTGIALLNRKLLFYGPPEAVAGRTDIEHELRQAGVAVDHPAPVGDQR